MATQGPKVPPWLPLGLALAAFACAALFAGTGSEEVRRFAGAFFTLALGAALGLWGVNELGQGGIRARSRRISRLHHPRLFWLLVLATRLVPGGLLSLAGVWLLGVGLPG